MWTPPGDNVDRGVQPPPDGYDGWRETHLSTNTPRPLTSLKNSRISMKAKFENINDADMIVYTFIVSW